MSEEIKKILSTDVSNTGIDELQTMLETLQGVDTEQFTDEERAQIESKIDEIKGLLEKSASVE